MRSLRSRLIVGSALVALVPLALAMSLFARRMERTVREQAGERLDGTLAGLRGQLASDGERLSARLAILAADPTLKRLYLVRGDARELPEELADKRFLLGLDFLAVTDTAGVVVAEAAVPESAAADARRAQRASLAAAITPAADGTPRLAALPDDSALVLTAGAPIRYEGDVVGTLRGGQWIDRGSLARMKQSSGVELTLADPAGRRVAGTRPTDAGGGFLTRATPLAIGAAPWPTLAGAVSTAASDHTIARLQQASALLGLLGLLVAVVLGAVWSSQVSRPVERLAAFSHRVAQGDWDEPLAIDSVRELETLVAALERMRSDLHAYRDRLRVSERQAAWSQMARKVAHEIRNPLTPIAVSVADLRRSYGRDDFPAILEQCARTIAAEVETLKRMLEEFSAFGRLPAPQPVPCSLGALTTDLATLYAREVAEGRLAIAPPAPDVTLTADPGLLRQALVNLVKNGLEAVDGAGRVDVRVARCDRGVEIVVADDGVGLSAEQRAGLFVPGFTTKAHGSGLGLTIVERIVSDHGGAITVDPPRARGTTFRIRLPLPAEG